MTWYVVPIVEGHTEQGCIEKLLQRIWRDVLAMVDRLQVLPPSRGNRDSLVHAERPDLGTKVEEAHTKLRNALTKDSSGRGLLLLLLDAEDDCPKELAPKLLQRAQQARPDTKISCVMATRMFENWMVAAAASLAGFHGLPVDLIVPDHPEKLRGSLWLDKQMRRTKPPRKYRKTVDAGKFVATMNLELCRENSPSFQKLCRDLTSWVERDRQRPSSDDPASIPSSPRSPFEPPPTIS